MRNCARRWFRRTRIWGRSIRVPENDWVLPKAAKMSGGDFAYAIGDFYLTNPIARASQLMAELSAGAKARRTEFALAAE